MKAPNLAIVFGEKPKGGDDDKSSPSMASKDDRDDKPDDKPDDDELPAGFESAATEAFPDLEGDPDRLKAFLRAVKACTGEY